MAEECQMNNFLNFDIPTVTEPSPYRDLLTIRHVIEKNFRSLLSNSKKLTFLILPRKKVKSTDFGLFEVKDHKRLALKTNFCCFWDFCNILNHITGV